MNDVYIKFKKIYHDVQLPYPATAGAAGSDVRAYLGGASWVIHAQEVVAIPTGFCMEIPHGYEAQVRTRSGLTLKSQIVVLNSPGTIDSDYRGEVKVIIKNLSEFDYLLSNGDRIAQMIIAPVIHAIFKEVEELSQTERGEGGFGSSGLK